MLRSGLTHADEDMKLRALREQQVEAARGIESVRQALAEDGALLSPEEAVAIEELLVNTDRAARGEEPEAVRVAVEALNRGTELFAARRMDRTIRAALSGRTLEDIKV